MTVWKVALIAVLAVAVVKLVLSLVPGLSKFASYL
jgi:hypothetical protein